MDALYDMIVEVFGDSSITMLAVMVFSATAVLTFGVMVTIHSRGAVKRVLDYTNKHYSQGDKGDAKVLRRRMILAGIYDPRAVALFFVTRTALAVGLAAAMSFILPMLLEQSTTAFWLTVVAAGIGGYLAPSLYLDRRIAQR